MKLRETWDLEGIFAGGSASPVFAGFLARLDEGIEALAAQVDALGAETEAWTAAVDGWQRRAAELGEAYSFVECLAAADTGDAVATALGGRLDALEARLKAIEVEIDRRMLALSDEAWRRLLEQEELAPVAFFLNRQRTLARHKMDPRRETLAETLAVDGYHAWGRMYDKLAGSLRASVSEDGGQVELSMGQLVHRLEDGDGAVRADALRHLEEAWRGVQDLAAMALNSQAGFRHSLYAGRGWQSILWEPLHLNRLQPETLQAMWSAIAAKSAALLPYLEAKARLLKIDRMRWADLVAPVANSERRLAYGDAADYIVERFAAFGGELGDFARHAFTRRWIEVEDRPGKAAGGFCTDLPLSRQTRIFMTYGGTFGGASTLAHELGHAYHAWLLRERPYFATHYPMALAETASTFCETLIMDAALDAADGEQELALLGNIGDEAVMMLMNLRSRFLFETAFFERRADGPLTADELSALMVEAQREAYCGGLAEDGYHPLFWASKLHFYLTSMPFYNFPYVFGYLFSNGLSALARREGPAFAEAYARLLEDTGSMTCEELAERHLGEDLTGAAFWERAVDRVLEVVPRFTRAAVRAG
ncbi:MAG: M3 family oligoendopeptidase [Spirochaetaceae bacterium]|nr:M3 family oligoendopeptidase [Spirochaetaceae bacterium]